MIEVQRCDWARSPLDIAYHDTEWGVPVHDDRTHFEFIILEGAQAGLSWSTILKKRERYREVLDGFDPERVARYTKRKLDALLRDPGIVRNKLKVASLVPNARGFLDVQDEFGSFDAFVWPFVGGAPSRAIRRSLADIPAKTRESDALSKELLRRGFKFVGSTICYAYMQACGLVDDHVVGCFRHARRP
ncbi:MAG TPA: DNA-3-methyladenine glycosylase I [Gemmatimonadaceae bacterium]|nr:DNA-3-methyladenine glycosylase I [Gemmatimonadaceae bacterium]